MITIPTGFFKPMKNNLEFLIQLSNHSDRRSIEYLSGFYYLTFVDKLIKINEALDTETTTSSNALQMDSVNGILANPMTVFNSHVIFCTERFNGTGTDGVRIYTYDGTNWTEQYDYAATTNAVLDMYVFGSVLYVSLAGGIDTFDTSFNKADIGTLRTSKVDYLTDIYAIGEIGVDETAYKWNGSTWDQLNVSVEFNDLANDGSEMLYFNTTAIYKVSGSSLVKLHDINVGSYNSRVFYHDNFFYWGDENGMIYKYSKTTGLAKAGKLTNGSVFDFTVNGSSELILHENDGVNSRLYKVLM